MIQGLIDGICKKLKYEFGESHTIYTKQVEQGLKEPCFFVQFLDDAENKMNSIVYKNELDFMITYLPEKSVDYGVAERVLYTLEIVETADGQSYRGYRRKLSVQDNVGHISVTYTAYVQMKAKNAVIMKELRTVLKEE